LLRILCKSNPRITTTQEQNLHVSVHRPAGIFQYAVNEIPQEITSYQVSIPQYSVQPSTAWRFVPFTVGMTSV